MESKLVQGQQQPPEYLPLPSLECIEVPKIFDWVLKTTQIVMNPRLIQIACLCHFRFVLRPEFLK